MHSPLRTRFKLPKRVTAKLFSLSCASTRSLARGRPLLDRFFPLIGRSHASCSLSLRVLPPTCSPVKRGTGSHRANQPAVVAVSRLLRPFGVRDALVKRSASLSSISRRLKGPSQQRCNEISGPADRTPLADLTRIRIIFNGSSGKFFLSPRVSPRFTAGRSERFCATVSYS